MPSFKSQYLPAVLLCFIAFFFFTKQLQAQPSPHPLQALQQAPVDPRNARLVDSLQMLNDAGSRRSGRWVAGQGVKQTTDARARMQKERFRPLQFTPNPGGSRSNLSDRLLNTVCYTVSGRDFLRQDSLILWTGDPCFSSDGNVIVSGEFADYSTSPLVAGGFCMKTDREGNVIWAKLYDSALRKDYSFINYFKPLELRDGSILLAGRTSNNYSKNSDFVLTRLDKNGAIIWVKTYESKFWKGFNGSGDYFLLRDLEEDPATGEVYFVGSHWEGASTVTKIDPADGHIIWSNAYTSWSGGSAFGIVINDNNLLLFQLENGSYNNSYINATAIRKTNGDTLYSKHFSQTGDLSAARLYNTYEVVKQNNGHFLLSGPTTRYWEFPEYTGTIDLYHAGIIELDENLDFVKAYGFKNRIQSNAYNTRISLYPDGTGVFTMLKIFPGYGFTAEAQVCVFRNEQIYHERKRLHYNEGLPYEPPTLRMPDGGFLNIKLMGDSTKTALDGSRIDYYRMHTSDTASFCLGEKVAATSLWYFNFEPVNRGLSSIQPNVFRESRVKTLDTWDFTASPGPACQVISYCDTLALKASAATVCPGTSVTVTIHKNAACGSLVPLVYDTNWVSRVTRLNDTAYAFVFDKPGKGYIRGSLMGCVLQEDSVLIEVLPARFGLDLGKDFMICPGNRIELNAGTGFASYAWQDGSTDSVFTVRGPGLYHVAAVNGCGTTYRDTIEVSEHPPVPIDIGPDRIKCNNDTLHLTAPPGFLNYTWSNNYNISSLDARGVVVNPLTDTAYYIKAEKTPGCFAFDTVRVTVYQSPPIHLGSDRSLCHGDSAVLNAGSGFHQYLWNNGVTVPQIVVKTAGSYAVMATSRQGCKSYDTVRVLNVFANPAVNLDPGNSLCTGSSRLLDAGNFSTYLWNDGTTTKTKLVTDTGTYAVKVTDSHGCSGSDTTVITTLLPLPTDMLPGDTSICSYGSATLAATSPYSSYRWSTGSTSPSITISQAGLYWLEVKDSNGCEGRDSVRVGPKECMQGLYAPTAFTPNGDGNNDSFRPLLFGAVKKYQLVIYNRWGQVIFQTTELNRGWDGKYGGTLQDSNVFIWTCTYQLDGTALKTERGTVLLVR